MQQISTHSVQLQYKIITHALVKKEEMSSVKSIHETCNYDPKENDFGSSNKTAFRGGLKITSETFGETFLPNEF